MSEWTPGPWEWTVTNRIKGRDPDTGNPVLVVRLLRSTDRRGDEPLCQLERWDADAHLIAAAPDLYEALGAMMRCHAHIPQKIMNIAHRARAKARGEA